MVELAPLLERVERASGKRFLIDRRLGSKIYLGTVDANDVTYPVLLSILWVNGFAAFESEGLVKIVPDANMRFYETRIVQADDASIPADEFVTRVLATVNVGAPQDRDELRRADASGGTPGGSRGYEPTDPHGPICEHPANHRDRSRARRAAA